MDTEKIFKLPYEQFVAKLKDEAAKEKVRSLILSGRKDGDPDDEIVQFKNVELTSRDLTPLQKQLLIESSLKHSLAGKSIATLKDTIDGLPVMINNEPVLTLDGKYIIDGHHRWVEAYVINPNSKIACIDIQLNMNPFDVIKIIQLAIAGNSGDIPFSKNEGTNLFTISQDEFRKFVEWTASDKVLKVYKKTTAELADYLWNNVINLRKHNKPIIGAPDRIFMPQVSKSPNALKSLANGEVDYKKPFAKMERRIPTLDEFINESVDNTSLYLQYFPSSCQLAVAGQQDLGLNMKEHEWLNTPELLKLKSELRDKQIKFAFGEHQEEKIKVESILMANGFTKISFKDHGLKFEYLGTHIASAKDAAKAVKEIINAHLEVTSKMSVLDDSLFAWSKSSISGIGNLYKGISLVTDAMFNIFKKTNPVSYVTSDFEYSKAEAAYNEVTSKGKILFTDDFTKTFLKGDLPDHNINWYEYDGAYYFVSYPRHKTYVVIKLKNKPTQQDSIVTQLD